MIPPQHNPQTTYWAFVLLGAGTLFPWNAFITVNEYFSSRFCGSSFQSDYLSYFSVTFNFFEVCTLILCVITSLNMVTAPLVVYVGLFILTSLSIFVSSVSPTSLFIFTIACLSVVGTCTALLSGGVFGLAGAFPPEYTQAVMMGQGLAGTVVSISSIVTAYAAGMPSDYCESNDDNNDDECAHYKTDYAAFAYFLVAVFTLLACIFVYKLLEEMPITKFYRAQNKAGSDKSSSSSGSSSDEENIKTKVNVIKEPLLDVVMDSSLNTTQSTTTTKTITTTLELIQITILPASAVAIIFLVTLAIFPTINSKILSSQNCAPGSLTSRWSNDLFVPLSFLLYNLFDFVGRVLAGRVSLELFSGRSLLFWSLSRLIFFPLFLLCNVDGSVVGTPFGDSDIFPTTFMIVFATSNGFLSSLCMMLGPTMVEPKDQIKCGNVMIFFLSAGLMAGSLLSFVTLRVSTGEF